MDDFLDVKKREIKERLAELKPLVEEYHRLEAASSALEGSTPRTATRATRGASRGTTRKTAGSGRRRGRPKGTGARSNQTLDLVKAQPGVTIPELASSMGIKQNYLYRVLPALERDGKVTKKGRGWHAR